MLGRSGSAPASRSYRFGDTTKGSPLPLILLGSILIAAVLLGGGGVRYALSNLAIQLIALVVLAIRYEAVLSFWQTAPIALRLLAIGTIALPLAQLVPLPENVWSQLPGRELVAEAFSLAGREGWAPGSVDPVRTTVALTGMIVPFAILTATWNINHRQLIILGWVIVGLGLANFLIGVPQVLSGGTAATLYNERAADSILHGTFANRNSTGMFMIAALALAIVLPFPRPHRAVQPIRIAVCVLLVIGVILTRSRSALLLTILPLALAGAKTFWWSRKSGHVGPAARLGLLGLASFTAGAAVLLLALSPGRVADTVERFEAGENARTYIWQDAAVSAQRFWPAGAGMGTFDEVFQLDEALENTTLKRAGRAHNEYLEVAIEAGAPGLALIALWLLLIAWLAGRARLSEMRWMAWGGAITLLAIALQSIVDYPLRNQAMLATAAFALLLLVRSSKPAEEAT